MINVLLIKVLNKIVVKLAANWILMHVAVFIQSKSFTSHNLIDNNAFQFELFSTEMKSPYYRGIVKDSVWYYNASMHPHIISAGKLPYFLQRGCLFKRITVITQEA